MDKDVHKYINMDERTDKVEHNNVASNALSVDENMQAILTDYAERRIPLGEAVCALRGVWKAEEMAKVRDLGHTQVDLDRRGRTGVSEVIFGQGKTPEQIVEIARALTEGGHGVLVTRIAEEAARVFLEAFPTAIHHRLARLVMILPEISLETSNAMAADTSTATSIGITTATSTSTAAVTTPSTRGVVGVVSAGTSDLPIAEEAALTAEFLGNKVERFYDCGVAGLHRLLKKLPEIRQAKVLIAVAGMEGALPSVLAGLVKVPVIAVPTSVGYGANLEGVTTLLAMLNSCANGISVVNIDNGFGAGYNAHLINNL